MWGGLERPGAEIPLHPSYLLSRLLAEGAKDISRHRASFLGRSTCPWRSGAPRVSPSDTTCLSPLFPPKRQHQHGTVIHVYPCSRQHDWQEPSHGKRPRVHWPTTDWVRQTWYVCVHDGATTLPRRINSRSHQQGKPGGARCTITAASAIHPSIRHASPKSAWFVR